MTRGVIIYNRGLKMVVRIIVCAHSLRKHYDGPVTILSEGDDSHKPCRVIAAKFGFNFKEVEYPQTPQVRNAVYLNAPLCVTTTPYDVSMWLDSDTIVRGDFRPMFDAAEKHEFAIAQFSNWRSDRGQIRKRILAWKGIHPDEWLEGAQKHGHAINCGVFAFRKDSALMRDWWSLAVKGPHLQIPDETCCQVILHRYPHKMMPAVFNVSCKYGLAEHFKDCRILHAHGRKHCRIDEDGKLQYNAGLWYEEFDEVRNQPSMRALVEKYIQTDRQLRHYLPLYEGMKNDS